MMASDFRNQTKTFLVLTFVILMAPLAGCKQQSNFSGGNQPASPRKPIPQKPQTGDQTVVPPQTTPPQSVQPITPPPTAVTKGSFTVWADPANPAAFEPYNIHIRVKLPPNTVNYSPWDLSGTLIGTDMYRQAINYGPQYFSFVAGSPTAELVMRIPGAEFQVEDTITVRSQLINEEQSLKIVFN